MKRPALLLLSFLSILLLYLSVQSYLKSRSRENELIQLRAQVDGLQGKVEEKQEHLNYRKSPEFIYKEALEQLGLTNPDEMITILPDWEEKKKSFAASSDQPGNSSSSASSAAPSTPMPYWKQWRVLFFGN